MQEPDSYWVGYLAETLAHVLDTDDIGEAHRLAAATLCVLLLQNDRLSAGSRHVWVKAIVKEEVRNGPRQPTTG